MIRSREVAIGELTPVLGRLASLIRAALAEYLQEHMQLRAKYRGATEASVIHSYIRHHVEIEFPPGNRDGVRVIGKYNTCIVAIGDLYLIKLKKLGTHLRASNVPTNEALKFMNQEPEQRELIPSPTHLHAGYHQQCKAELLNAQIWLVCPNGQRWHHWAYDLTALRTGHVVPIRNQQTTRRRRARPKADVLNPTGAGPKKADGDENE